MPLSSIQKGEGPSVRADFMLLRRFDHGLPHHPSLFIENNAFLRQLSDCYMNASACRDAGPLPASEPLQKGKGGRVQFYNFFYKRRSDL